MILDPYLVYIILEIEIILSLLLVLLEVMKCYGIHQMEYYGVNQVKEMVILIHYTWLKIMQLQEELQVYGIQMIMVLIGYNL